MVSFCPSRDSLTWSRMRRAERFGVNLLGRQHERFAIRAAPAGADRFAGLDWELGPGGAPLVTDALASLECEIVAEHPAGDHWIVVGRVDDLCISPIKAPLVFFAGAFRTVATRSSNTGKPPFPRRSNPPPAGYHVRRVAPPPASTRSPRYSCRDAVQARLRGGWVTKPNVFSRNVPNPLHVASMPGRNAGV
jgi:hypothetical protein